MSDDVILKVENLSKQYRLGNVGTGTLAHDLNRTWHKLRGKEDPYLKIGAVNDRGAKATSDYVWALQDINFEVKRGEILGIIGKNGAGKSTLLKILSRVTSPSTGTIAVGGRMASLLEVGTGMHPELTGRENIYLNGAILGMTKKEIASKIDDIVAFSGCEMYIDTPVKRYSSGMGVRLGFAVAAFLEPDILVVDEVLAVGDAEFQKKAIGKMQDISKTSGRTVLFVSHNMAAVKNLCTRAIVLENGITAFNGKTDESVDFYLNLNNLKSKIVFQSKFLKFDNSIIEQIDFGQDLRLSFDVEFHDFEHLTLGYVILNQSSNLLAGANMYQTTSLLSKNDGNKVDFIIKNINLIPGIYYISLYIGNGDFDVEILEEVITFQVNWNMEISLPKSHWGNLYFKTLWEQK